MASGRDGEQKPLLTPCPNHLCGPEGFFGAAYPGHQNTQFQPVLLCLKHLLMASTLCAGLCAKAAEDFYKPYMDLGFLLGVLTPMQDLESTNSNLKPRILCQKGRCAEGQPWSSR